MEVELLAKPNLHVIHEAVKICRKSNDPDKALEYALQAGHLSLLEHLSFTFRIEGISRACSHQLVRHRIASYTQESQRFVKVDDQSDWYVAPDGVPPEYHTFMQACVAIYDGLIAKGIPVEDARYVLPNATKTNIIVTMNCRSLDNFFLERCCNYAQKEIRVLAFKMLDLTKSYIKHFDKRRYPDCRNCKNPCKNPTG